jgi:hypothetical protein
MRATKKERQESLDYLREILKPGQEIYTQCQHVSKSGMTRWLDLYVMRDNRPHRITWDVCAAADFVFCDRRGQLKIEGCGMDMGFQAVYCLGHAIWPDGTPEPHGTRNGEPDTNGGYALTQRWL